MIRGLEFSVPRPHSPAEGERGWRRNQSRLGDEASRKSQKDRVWGASGWWTRGDSGTRSGHGSPALSPGLACGSHLFPGLHLQSETGDSLRSVSCWSQLTQPKEGRRSLEVLAIRLKGGARQSGGTEPFP